MALEDIPDSELFAPPKIVMSVVEVKLNKHIDVALLARKTVNAHYQKRRFAACIIRTPNGVGLFFASGTIMITFGHLDLREEMEALYMKKIQFIDPTVEKRGSHIVNTTVACGANAKLYLHRVHRASKQAGDVKFVPELFPGMSKCVKVGNNDNIKFMLFCSGKYNILGCKSREEIDEAYKYSVQWLRDFLKVRTQNAVLKNEGSDPKRRRLD